MSSYSLSATYNTIKITNISFDTNYTYMQVYWRLSTETTATVSGWISRANSYNITYITNTSTSLSPDTTYTVNIAGSNSSTGSNNVFIGPQNITTASITDPPYYSITPTTTSLKLTVTYAPSGTKYAYFYRLPNTSSYTRYPSSGSTSDTSHTFTGLSANTEYIVNVVAYTDVGGWSDSDLSKQSARTLNESTKMYININGVWKAATPYININGTWRRATPYININGTWRS